ncbi:MAG TPA: diguanylate cyclase, partial [Candidatus Binatia bacterium]|nr:diguanylate cyclase [Candidatus Binatia bacterium]
MAEVPPPNPSPATPLVVEDEAEIRLLGKFPSQNPNPVLRVGRDGVIGYANAAGQVLLNQFHCQVGEKVPTLLGQLVTDGFGQGPRREIQVEAAGGWFSFAVTPIRDADYVYLYGHDVSPLKETQKELIQVKDQAQHRALHDALTGLPNRTLLEDRLQQAIARSQRNREKLAVVFLDLDNFKQVNDAQGHRAGDQVLRAVADQLRAALRQTDTVARWGGDEMILLLPEMHQAQEAFRVCQRIKSNVEKHFAGSQMAFAPTLSMGIAVYPDDAALPETLLQQADMALYLAKSRGRNEVVLFSASEELKAFRPTANLHALLRQAVSEEKIQAHYQPIVSAGTGRVVAIEALARWHQEPLGWI